MDWTRLNDNGINHQYKIVFDPIESEVFETVKGGIQIENDAINKLNYWYTIRKFCDMR